MEAKNNEHLFDLDGKNQRRIKLQHPARFSRNEENGKWEDCVLINIDQNLTGVGVRFHACKEIKAGAMVTIDVMTSDTSVPLCITGTVKWVKQMENDCIGGIKLISTTDTLKRLLLKEALSERK
jgi:hypothetical protein